MPGTNLRKFAAKLAGYGVQFAVGVAAGVGANTNITITGIKPGDEIVAFLQFPPPNDTGTTGCFDRTATGKVTALNTVQNTVATNSPANSVVLVLYASTPRKRTL